MNADKGLVDVALNPAGGYPPPPQQQQQPVAAALYPPVQGSYPPPPAGAAGGVYPPPAGVYPPPQSAYPPPPPAAAFQPPPVPSLAPPCENEVKMAQSALGVALPAWQARLAAALGVPAPVFLFRLDALVAPMPKTLQRVSALQLVVGAAPKHGDCLLEALTAAVELACQEPAVRADIAARITQIDLVSLPAEAKWGDKSIALHGTTLVLTLALAQGSSGSFTREALAAFLERTFYAEERYLVTRFVHESVPAALAAIEAAVGAPVALDMDIVAELGKVATQQERLPMAQTLVSISGLERSATEAARSLDYLLTKVVRGTEKAVTGTARTPAPVKGSVDVFHSPNFLKPLVAAFTKAAADPGVAATLRNAIATIKFENVAGKDKKGRLLAMLPAGGSTPLAPTVAGVPPVAHGVLLYRCVLGAGSSGLFSETELAEFFELHFKAHEKALMARLVTVDADIAQRGLAALFQRPVPIEFVWPSIYPDTLAPKERLTIAEAMTHNHSEHLLVAIVGGLTDVLSNNPNAQAAVVPAITKIAIQMTPGTGSTSAVPSLYLSPTPAGQVLVYSPALQLGLSGLLIRHQFRDRVRGLFNLPIPPQDKSLGASLNKVTADLNRLGQSFLGTKLF